MGNDLSLAVLSDQAPPLFSYFKQLFAQVTNPPIDSIREEIVMSLATSLGTERNLFDETPEHAHKLVLDQPILLNRELETLRHVSHDVFAARTIDITWPLEEGAAGMSEAIARICREAQEAIAERVNIIVLSDRLVGPRRVPIPRCWRSPPSTTTSCARARACAPGSSSSRASRARCTTSPR